ncbi:hypothetical protein Bhyg_05886 [Pseudolycoriella hygida]|uniref:Uncharacterized protein n=1 Tax=Pseudolycoriella hygida TaxID=35572 RepID=A0A9Q0MZJ0_9DIPT|nr:hypothetical protein Bhyg_05886 [Pseudolycoriella hygida]
MRVTIMTSRLFVLKFYSNSQSFCWRYHNEKKVNKQENTSASPGRGMDNKIQREEVAAFHRKPPYTLLFAIRERVLSNATKHPMPESVNHM